MKVLVIGGGGREHALVWAIRQSPRVREVVCAPGNGGIAELARCIPVQQDRLPDLLRAVNVEQPDLTIVGPELPLSLGLVDEMTRLGMRVFGPTRQAAMLETSKAFAKLFMLRHQIPTAHYSLCHSVAEIPEALSHFHTPIVVKADGLAAGKGVVICETKKEAEQTAARMLQGELLAHAESKVIFEEFLTGEEISLLMLCDGKHVVPLAPAQDHKRIGEGDTGANTGGMGAYSTDKLLTPEMRDWLVAHIGQPVIDGMAAEDAPFVGVLYCGLMMTARGPMVLEFNARFGDPETQAILPRIVYSEEGGLLEALEAAAEGRLAETALRWRREPSITVVAASQGYPGDFSKGHTITGLDEAAREPGVTIFHAGTAIQHGETVTAGGRVLSITALGNTPRQARDRAYAAIKKIHFEGMYYRRDIARRALDKEVKGEDAK